MPHQDYFVPITQYRGRNDGDEQREQEGYKDRRGGLKYGYYQSESPSDEQGAALNARLDVMGCSPQIAEAIIP